MAEQRQEKQVLHYPRLDTVLMVEEARREGQEYKGKMELWRSLPKQVMYQTFLLILDYLEKSNKIIVCKDGKIVWIFAKSQKQRELLKKSVKA